MFTGDSALRLLEVIERVTRQTAPGPAPSFNEAHVVKALEIIGKCGTVGRIKLSKEGLDKGESEIEKIFKENPYAINIYRVTGDSSHVVLYGFRDMNELDYFFHSPEMKEKLHRFIETQELITFSHNSLIKNSPVQLFHKIVDNLGSKVSEVKFSELERFKKKLG